jgi:hypothetical protein
MFSAFIGTESSCLHGGFMQVWMRFSFLAAVLSLPLCAQSVYHLPQVIDGVAPGGSLRTTIILAKSSATTANVIISLFRDDGSPRQ